MQKIMRTGAEKDLCKIKLYSEFGVTNHELKFAMNHYNLMEDQEFKAFLTLVEMQQKAEQQKEQKEVALPEAVRTAIENEAKAMGRPSVKQDGTLTYDYYLESSKVIEKHLHTFVEPRQLEHDRKRREFTKMELAVDQ